MEVSNSILITIKRMLGIDADYHAFDTDILSDINTVFVFLSQLGVGPDEGFEIQGEDATWSDYLGEDHKRLLPVKTYIYMRVRLMFDPPTSSTLIDAIKQQISELEFRLNVEVDPKK